MSGPFTKVHHICIVVHDIDKAQAFYESVGVVPWAEYPPLAEYEDLDVPSKQGFLSIKYRICNLPGMQLQLCQPGAEPSPQREHLDRKGEGVFHIGFEVPDADAAEAQAVGKGLRVLMRGRRANRTGFTYYDSAAAAGVILLTRATNRPGQ
jgi:catechol 2,3-dioxygenase-like lactoylglutathione lyase family enzyme